MLSLKQFLTKLVTTEAITTNITVTSGTLVSYAIWRCGKVINLRLSVSKSTATAAGANVFTGNIQNHRPKENVYGVGYLGSTAGVISISSAGNIAVRACGGQMSANNPIWVGISYVEA